MVNISAQQTDLLLTLSDIQTRLSSHQLQNIRFMEIHHINWVHFENVSSDPSWFPNWTSFCSMLASIKGLQHLQIWMVREKCGTPQLTSTQEADFFIPLLAIKG